MPMMMTTTAVQSSSTSATKQHPGTTGSSAHAQNQLSAAGPNTGGASNFMGGLARVSASGSGEGAAVDRDSWTFGGAQFASPVREVYTRSLYRICLKFTTSEDEDEGKLEPATAYWTCYGKPTTIGNGGPGSPQPDDICRRMDDSMTGPSAGILTRLNDEMGENAAMYALKSETTCGWHARGDRGDAAMRVSFLYCSHSSLVQ